MILFFDLVGGAYDGNTVRTKPQGGSELAQVQLAEALAGRGHEVVMINAAHTDGVARYEVNGVSYGGSVDTRELKTVILARMTPLPSVINPARTKVIVSLTDQGPHTVADCDLLVGVSQWQVNRFALVSPHTPCKVIPPIIERAPKVKKTQSYLYAGAAMKGLDETLQGWDDAGCPGELYVITGGWGEPDEAQRESMRELGVGYLGNRAPATFRAIISGCSYLLGYKAYPETFCATAAIAETCGTLPILYSPHGRTGLDEAINTPVFYDREEWLAGIRSASAPISPLGKSKDFSASHIARLWEKVL